MSTIVFMPGVIGVLALQGASDKHFEILTSLGVEGRAVRFSRDLAECDALIIPGGESTTMSLLIQEFSLYDCLCEFAASKPVMGVCAGAILMAADVDDSRVCPLKLLPMTAVRNSYGRQVCSFSTDIQLQCDNSTVFAAHFIRAPLLQPHDERLEVLASYNNAAIMLKMGHHMALSFHPELTSDNRVHACWLNSFHPLN